RRGLEGLERIERRQALGHGRRLLLFRIPTVNVEIFEFVASQHMAHLDGEARADRLFRCESRSYRKMLTISSVLTWIERSHMRKRLLGRDDRVLADFGISRELLQRGVRAWPWKAPTDPSEGLGRFNLEAVVAHDAGHAAAIAELETYTDADLWDLGL